MAEEIEYKLLIHNASMEYIKKHNSIHITQGYYDLNNTNFILEKKENLYFISIFEKKDRQKLKIIISKEKFIELKSLFNLIEPGKYKLSTKNHTVARIRKTTKKNESSYEITIKSNKESIIRNEVDINLPAHLHHYADYLFDLTSNYLIEKTRYLIPSDIQNLIWEFDVFEGENKGLIIAEIEVESIKTPCPKTPKDWKYSEITQNYDFSNDKLTQTPISKRNKY